jgi:hypothetical protein
MHQVDDLFGNDRVIILQCNKSDDCWIVLWGSEVDIGLVQITSTGEFPAKFLIAWCGFNVLPEQVFAEAIAIGAMTIVDDSLRPRYYKFIEVPNAHAMMLMKLAIG